MKTFYSVLCLIINVLFATQTFAQSKWMLKGVVKELHYQGIDHKVVVIKGLNIRILVKQPFDSIEYHKLTGDFGDFFCYNEDRPAGSRIDILTKQNYEWTDSSQREDPYWVSVIENSNYKGVEIIMSRKGAIEEVAKRNSDKKSSYDEKEYVQKSKKLDDVSRRKDETYRESQQILNIKLSGTERFNDSLANAFARLDTSEFAIDVFNAYSFFFNNQPDSSLYYISTLKLQLPH